MSNYPGTLEYAYKLNELLNGGPFKAGYVRAELWQHYPRFIADIVRLTTPQPLPDNHPDNVAPFFPQ